MKSLTNCYCGNDDVNGYVDKARNAYQDEDIDGAIDELGHATRFTRHGENSNICFALGELYYHKFNEASGNIDADSMATIIEFVEFYRNAYIFKDQ